MAGEAPSVPGEERRNLALPPAPRTTVVWWWWSLGHGAWPTAAVHVDLLGDGPAAAAHASPRLRDCRSGGLLWVRLLHQLVHHPLQLVLLLVAVAEAREDELEERLVLGSHALPRRLAPAAYSNTCSFPSS